MTREMALASIGRALAAAFPGEADAIIDAAFYNPRQGPTGNHPTGGLILAFDGPRGEHGEWFVKWSPESDYGVITHVPLHFLPVLDPSHPPFRSWHLTIFFPHQSPKGT